MLTIILIFLGILVLTTVITGIITLCVFKRYELEIDNIISEPNEATIYFLLICLSISLTYIFVNN
jgi:hypothetical protein